MVDISMSSEAKRGQGRAVSWKGAEERTLGLAHDARGQGIEKDVGGQQGPAGWVTGGKQVPVSCACLHPECNSGLDPGARCLFGGHLAQGEVGTDP